MDRDPCKKNLQEIRIPQEIWRVILTRLPISCIVMCWSVCKLWRNLIEEDGMLAKQFMASVRQDMTGYAVADEDGQPLFRFNLAPDSTRFNSAPDSTLPYHRLVISSVNGLLLLWDGLYDYKDFLFIVNPITCEYTELPPLPARRCVYGFGVSKLSGRYKILCVDESRFCHVCTLGGECSWRRIPAPPTTTLLTLPGFVPWRSKIKPRPSFDYALFFNGNIHWVACDFENNFVVCCFDIETELFTSFPLQPLNVYLLRFPKNSRWTLLYSGYQLCILDDRLCLCDISHPTQYKIWKMVNYADASSWTMEYIIEPPLHVRANPLKVPTPAGFIEPYAYHQFPSITIYTPSFFSLKTLGIHNVHSFCLH